MLRRDAQTTKSGRLKGWCINEFPKHGRANTDHMPTLEHCYLVTPAPLCSQPVCAHTPMHTHTFHLPPDNGLRQDPGRLTSPAHPFPLSCSPPTDPLSDGPLFTFTLLRGPAGPGGRPNRYIIVWSSLRAPLHSRPSLTPFTAPQKHHLYHPTVRQ